MPRTVLRYQNGYYGDWSWWYNLALDICQYLRASCRFLPCFLFPLCGLQQGESALGSS